MALDAYEQAAKVNPAPARGRRHRIEHIETIDPADIPRFGALGVIASQQPFHGTPDAEPDRRVDRQHRTGSRLARLGLQQHRSRAGGRLAFGSDWPVVTLDPRSGCTSAVTRTTPDGQPEGGWYPSEAIPLAEAIDAYTSGAAWASFDEQRKGTLARGHARRRRHPLARHLRARRARLDATVDTTIFDGKVVYTKLAAATN